MKTRIRESHAKAAVKALNDARGLSYPDIGYTYWADIKGDGRYRPSLWLIINENGGVTYSVLNQRTLRDTVEALEDARATIENGKA